jgi:hypothetical protein
VIDSSASFGLGFRATAAVVLCALFGLTDCFVRPALAARIAPVAEDSEKETKESKEQRQSADEKNSGRAARLFRLADRRGISAVTAQASTQPHRSFTSFSISRSDLDPFNNGIGTRLRC